VLSITLGLLVIWLGLATVYAVFVRSIAYFGDRSLRLGQCWNLAAAALMPGALLMVIAIVLYGLHGVDLIGLSVLSVLHLATGWVYILVAPFSAMRLSDIQAPPANPFG
jgi:hypothetical protein